MKKVVFCFVFILISITAVIVYGAEITVENVTGFFSMKPDTGAVFMEIKNLSNSDDFLIGANANIKDVMVEIHDVKDGQMVKIEKIHIPPKTTVELKKGGLHIMLFNLALELKENEEFKLILIFEKTGEIQLPVFKKTRLLIYIFQFYIDFWHLV